MQDHIYIKTQLRRYLQLEGVSYNKSKKTWRCPNHDDTSESAVLYENPDGGVLYCPVCERSWDIFELSKFYDNANDFKAQLKAVREILNITGDIPVTNKKEPKKTETIEPPVALPRQDAKPIYKRERIIEIYKMSKRSKLDKEKATITSSHPYTDIDGNIIAMDIRFEDGSGAKDVVLYWYNGKSLKTKGAPVLLYGLDRLNHAPVLIHEGGKCADIGQEKLLYFSSLSWSGGTGKVGKADWTPLADHETYILPDNDGPGIKAARAIKEQLPHAKIVKPPADGKGDDIEQYLQKLSADELQAYILNPDNHLDDIDVDTGESDLPVAKTSTPSNPSQPPAPVSTSMPFRILGIGDDGRAVYITESGRLVKYKLEGLGKSTLLVLANRTFWYNEYHTRDGKISWDGAVDDVIRTTQCKDFDESFVRGRGAWHDGDMISYHDGVNTYGEYAEGRIYLRLRKHDIGINDEPATVQLTKAVKDTIFKMSFETPADAVRCLAWSVLAPFAGALKYRPALLLTGESGSGKTTVATLCIRKLADCKWFNGSESTVAGTRGVVKYDSCGIMFEEVEADTLKKRTNREELFSLMRVNVSDDAPDTVKGTKEGGYNSFKMQNMFGFIAIDPTVESIADENRIFRVNMVKPRNGGDWKKIEEDIKNLLCEANCRKIRALAWNKLRDINTLTERIVDRIREKTGKDYRSSYADGMLAAAFMVVWTGTDNPSEEQIDNMLQRYYQYQPADDHRSEAEEIVDRLMDETIEVIQDHKRERLTIMECLHRIYHGTKGENKEYVQEYELESYKSTIARYGIRLTDDYNLAIQNNHHMIKRIIDRGSGYSKILKRHHGFIEGQRNVYFYNGKSPRCTILRGVIKKKDEDMSMDEKLEGLI
jgi:DNA replication protein DnaC/uncharacterized Zn finger protein (UPF0148 family)